MLDSPSPNDEAVALTNLPAKRLRDRSHLNFTSATVSTLRSPDRARAHIRSFIRSQAFSLINEIHSTTRAGRR